MSDEPKEIAEEEGEWQRLAWRAWLRGVRNYAALGRQFDKHWSTVKKAIKDQSEAVRLAIDSGDVEAFGEYVAGLAEDLGEAEKMYRETTVDNCRLGALKHMTDLREKLAAACGVVTKREGREHGGTVSIDFDELREALTNRIGGLSARVREADVPGESE